MQEEENQNEKLDQEDKENISMNGMATPIKQEALTQDKIVMKTKGNNLASDKIINQVVVDIIVFIKRNKFSFLLRIY